MRSDTTFGMILATLEESAASAALASHDDEERRQCLELRNQLKLHRVGEYIETVLNDSLQAMGLSELLRRMTDLPPPLPFWAPISVGYRVARERCTQSGRVRELLARADPALPSQALFPLHQGMGYAFAAYVLDPLSNASSIASVNAAISQFETLCNENATTDYLAVALEVLGFTAAGQSSALTEALNRHVSASHADLSRLYWHGAGRAKYFDLDGMASPRPAVDERSFVEGFAWQATLTNLENPVVLEGYLDALDSEDIVSAFASGVHSAFDTWRQCVPGDDTASRFAAHVPLSARQRVLWQRVVGTTCASHVRNNSLADMSKESVASWHDGYARD